MLEEFLFPISWNSGNAKDSDQGSGITPINRDLEYKKTRAILVILAPIILTGVISLFCWKLFAVRTYQSGPGIYPIRSMSSFNVRSAKWSPDGERIAVITTKRGDQTSPTEIYLLDWRSETSERIPTVAENASQERMDISQIDWAPDGKTLGFFGIPTDPKQQGIWLINLENNQMRFFAKGNRFSWSPTGDQIAVLDEPDAYSFAIKVIDLPTNEERLVLEFQHQEASTQMERNTIKELQNDIENLWVEIWSKISNR